MHFVCKPLITYQSIRVNIYWDSSQKVWPLNQPRCSLLDESQPQRRKKLHCLQEIGCFWIVRLMKHCSQKGGSTVFSPAGSQIYSLSWCTWKHMQHTGIRVGKKESEVGQGEKRYSVVLQIPPQMILCFVLRDEKP